MRPQIEILNLAAAGELPKVVTEKCDIDIEVFKELYASGLISAIDASADHGDCYLESKITIKGREYLDLTLEKGNPWWASMDRRLAVWSIVICILSVMVTFIYSR